MDTVKILIDSLSLKQPSQQTDYFPLILQISIPVFTLLLGFWLNSFLHRSTYKNEYYKIILNKRVQAYESLENVLRSLLEKDIIELTIQSTPIERTLAHCFFKDYQSFKDFKQEVFNMGIKTLWFSERLVIEISKLNQTILDIEKTFNHDNPQSYRQIGIQNHDLLVDFYINLRKLFVNDLKTLHNVKKFLDRHSELLGEIPMP